jgi:hypothetical protein
MCFIKVVAGHRMAHHKRNEDIGEEIGVTDVSIIIKILIWNRKPEDIISVSTETKNRNNHNIQ